MSRAAAQRGTWPITVQSPRHETCIGVTGETVGIVPA